MMALILTPIGCYGGRWDSERFTDNGGYDKFAECANRLASTGSYDRLDCNKSIEELKQGCCNVHLSDEAIRLLERGSRF